MTVATRVQKFLDLADSWLPHDDSVIVCFSDPFVDAAETAQRLAKAASEPGAHEGYLDAAYRDLTEGFPFAPRPELCRRAENYRLMALTYADTV